MQQTPKPRNEEYWCARGNKWLKSIKSDPAEELLQKAVKCYEKAISINSRCTEAWRSKGFVLQQLEQHVSAIRCFNRALAINRTYMWVWYYKGVSYSRLRCWDKSLICLDRYLFYFKDDSPANYEKGIALSELGRHESALSSFDLALAGNAPLNLQAYLGKAYLYYAMALYERCIECADSYIAIYVEDPEIWYLKSISCNELGRSADAKDSLGKSLSVAKKYGTDGYACEWWWERAHEYDKLGQFIREVFCYDYLIKMNSNYYLAMHEKACVLRDLGKVAESLTWFDRSLEIGPEDEEYWLALTNKGTALAKIGRHKEAQELYDQSLRNPDNYFDRLGETWHRKGESFMLVGNYKEALRCFQEAGENGWNYNGLNGKGQALAGLARYEEAIACFDTALSVNPDYFEAWSAKMDALKKLGKMEEFSACRQRCKELRI